MLASVVGMLVSCGHLSHKTTPYGRFPLGSRVFKSPFLGWLLRRLMAFDSLARFSTDCGCLDHAHAVIQGLFVAYLSGLSVCCLSSISTLYIGGVGHLSVSWSSRDHTNIFKPLVALVRYSSGTLFNCFKTLRLSDVSFQVCVHKKTKSRLP